jgi:hypothetical protein
MQQKEEWKNLVSKSTPFLVKTSVQVSTFLSMEHHPVLWVRIGQISRIRIKIGIQGLPMRIRIFIHFNQM